ncbi:MAG: hypothetical protein Ct9H90mP11_02970 [Acidimicrobiales bacterium]|nr:MAG: hypothetical protein Ct9H90mP11_02970 [Acidimicrobiales bacterium]
MVEIITLEEQMMARAISNALKLDQDACLTLWGGAVLVSSDGQTFDGSLKSLEADMQKPFASKKQGGKTQGATLYVTLEPCSHSGKTGPCVERIIESRLVESLSG